jgi:hypothetical protein
MTFLKSAVCWDVMYGRRLSSFQRSIFNLEDGGSMFLGNMVSIPLDYAVTHPSLNIHHSQNLKSNKIFLVSNI